MHRLVRIANAFDSLVSFLGRASTWLILVLVIVVIFDVITRRFLVLGSTMLQELEWHLHTVLFMFCVGFAYFANAHVRIDIFSSKLSERGKSWLELLGCLIFAIPYTALLLYLSVEFVQHAYVTGESSSAGTGLPHRWIIKAFLACGFALLLLACIGVFLRQIVILFGPPVLAAQVRAQAARRRGIAAEILPQD
jgi:TRAP-type mannitol/chloroaromatic compound transport system permease small subunit